MAPYNPLHAPVPAPNHSWYSSLGGAVGGNPPPPQSNRRLLPQPWCAPSPRRSTPSPLHPPITFDLHGSPTRGVPMRALHSTHPSLRGAADLVLAHSGRTRITLRILWPGYEYVEWARSIEVCSPSHVPRPWAITRAELGAAVSANYARFIEGNRGCRPASYEWHIGDHGIRFGQLVLVALHNVFEETWQAEVTVEL